MAAAIPMLDDVIKEYLVFRGFSNTLKSFESDLKADKDKSFRVSYFIEVLHSVIQHNSCKYRHNFSIDLNSVYKFMQISLNKHTYMKVLLRSLGFY